MAAKKTPKIAVDPAVHGQYEAYPYPPRDPADEAKRLITGSPSSILEIEHYVIGGRIPDERPFRALIAGGGTGDATIMLASQLAARAIPAEITHVDISAASLDGVDDASLVGVSITRIHGPHDHRMSQDRLLYSCCREWFLRRMLYQALVRAVNSKS